MKTLAGKKLLSDKVSNLDTHLQSMGVPIYVSIMLL